MEYLHLKLIHIIFATFYFGGGAVSAFYKILSWKEKNIHVLKYIHNTLVIVDYVFIIPAGVVLPLTGFWMLGFPSIQSLAPWTNWGVVFYILSGIFWLPAAYLQIRMKQEINLAALNNTPIPNIYYTYSKIWMWLGLPSFTFAILTFYVMVLKNTPW